MLSWDERSRGNRKNGWSSSGNGFLRDKLDGPKTQNPRLKTLPVDIIISLEKVLQHPPEILFQEIVQFSMIILNAHFVDLFIFLLFIQAVFKKDSK